MSFVQLIDCRTTHYEEVRAIDAEWEKATQGRRTLRRQITTRDRKDPRRHVVFCFFDSYESAMVNSALPETAGCAERYRALLEAPPVFVDLHVVEDRVADPRAAATPGFIQIIEIRSNRMEELQGIDREYQAAAASRMTVRRSLVTQDHADPQHFRILVFFDSYESAMENSALPETAALAGKMGVLLDSPPAFHDLDVLGDRIL